MMGLCVKSYLPPMALTTPTSPLPFRWVRKSQYELIVSFLKGHLFLDYHMLRSHHILLNQQGTHLGGENYKERSAVRLEALTFVIRVTLPWTLSVIITATT
jgi:hypothetical protein